MTDWKNKNLYIRLGVTSDAPYEGIRKAYYNLAKRYHPDMPNGSADAMAAIAQAWEVLSDQARRARYDEIGSIDLDDPQETMRKLALTQVMSMALDMIEKATDLGRLDLKTMMVKQIDRVEHEAKNQMKIAEKRLDRYNDAMKKIRKGQALISALTAKAADQAARIEKAKATMQVYDMAREIAEDIDWDHTLTVGGPDSRFVNMERLWVSGTTEP